MWLHLPPALRPVQCVQPLPADDGDEGVHDAAVKLLPGAAVQLLERLLSSDDSLVGGVGGHRVEGVADEDDTGAEWYIIACETVGVAAAIVVLVVVGDYRRGGRQGGKATGIFLSSPVASPPTGSVAPPGRRQPSAPIISPQ